MGIKLSVAGMALVLMMRLPLVALGNSGTDEEVALFSAAQRFGDAAWLLATTAGVALLPGVAYLAQAERARARGLLRRVLLATGAASVVLALAAQPLAESAMRLIFGGDFSSGGEVLQIVLAGLPAYVVAGHQLVRGRRLRWRAAAAEGRGWPGSWCRVVASLVARLGRRGRRGLGLRRSRSTRWPG